MGKLLLAHATQVGYQKSVDAIICVRAVHRLQMIRLIGLGFGDLEYVLGQLVLHLDRFGAHDCIGLFG